MINATQGLIQSFIYHAQPVLDTISRDITEKANSIYPTLEQASDFVGNAYKDLKGFAAEVLVAENTPNLHCSIAAVTAGILAHQAVSSTIATLQHNKTCLSKAKPLVYGAACLGLMTAGIVYGPFQTPHEKTVLVAAAITTAFAKAISEAVSAKNEAIKLKTL